MVRRVLDSGVLGEVFQMRRCASNYVRRSDWQALKKYGGGMLNNFGSHYIDQLLYFSGETVKKVFCRLQCVATLGDAEDVVRIVMETEKGAVLDVDINQAAAIYPEPLLIHGKYGAARLEKDSEGKEVRWYDPRELPSAQLLDSLTGPDRRLPQETFPWKEEFHPILPEDEADYYALCARYFTGVGPAPVPLEETIRVMELISACREAAD